MKYKYTLCFGLLFLTMTQVFAGAVEHVVWDKTPIHITLPLNQERLVHFPLAISIVDSELDEQVGVMKIQDALYFNAHAAFSNKRLVVQLMPEGETIVLSLSATEDASHTNPVEVVMEKIDKPESAMITPSASINPVTLTRFAIQVLYAPERLIVTPEQMVRTPMQTHKHITLVYGASITAKPLLSWRMADLYVTAIELKNDLNKSIVLDPRQLLGNWQTASFYPTNTLGPRAGNSSTTVFVTSSRPFGEALMETREFIR